MEKPGLIHICVGTGLAARAAENKGFKLVARLRPDGVDDRAGGWSSAATVDGTSVKGLSLGKIDVVSAGRSGRGGMASAISDGAALAAEVGARAVVVVAEEAGKIPDLPVSHRAVVRLDGGWTAVCLSGERDVVRGFAAYAAALRGEEPWTLAFSALRMALEDA